MKRISLLLVAMIVTAALNASAQDTAALDERVKQLSGYVQDLLEDKANQKRQIEALAREVQSLREQQSNQPKANYATQDDLRTLAKQVQEIEDNRKNDREVILKQIEKLAKVPVRDTPARPAPPRSGLPEKAAEHTVAAGDTFSTIAAAYSKELNNPKITTELIQKANPKVDPLKMQVGQVILVPIP